MAEIYSAKWVIWASVLINVAFTLLTPVAAKLSYGAVLVLRFAEGLGAVITTNELNSTNKSRHLAILGHQGVSLPATHVMLSKWALPEERNVISSFTFSGMIANCSF